MTDREPPPSTRPPVPVPQMSLGMRILYMVLFAIVFWILAWTLAATAVLQLLVMLLRAKPNPDVVRFGIGLAAYARQVIEFLTFASDKVPFPIGEWPGP